MPNLKTEIKYKGELGALWALLSSKNQNHTLQRPQQAKAKNVAENHENINSYKWVENVPALRNYNKR